MESGNVSDNAAMESFLSSLKTERIRKQIYRKRPQAKADVFDYNECIYNPAGRRSTQGYLSTSDFERVARIVCLSLSRCLPNPQMATLTVHVVEPARRGLVIARRAHRFAPDDTLQGHVVH
jgi:hypothetical protein